MIKTFLDLQKIDSMVAGMYQQNPELEKGKFGYLYKRFTEKNYSPILKELREKIQDIQVENALTSESTKELLTNPDGSYKYSKDGQKARLSAERALYDSYNEKEIEITPFITTDIPELTEEQRELLTGCII